MYDGDTCITGAAVFIIDRGWNFGFHEFRRTQYEHTLNVIGILKDRRA
jgi:hypothetical protein